MEGCFVVREINCTFAASLQQAGPITFSVRQRGRHSLYRSPQATLASDCARQRQPDGPEDEVDHQRRWDVLWCQRRRAMGIAHQDRALNLRGLLGISSTASISPMPLPTTSRSFSDGRQVRSCRELCTIMPTPAMAIIR